MGRSSAAVSASDMTAVAESGSRKKITSTAYRTAPRANDVRRPRKTQTPAIDNQRSAIWMMTIRRGTPSAIDPTEAARRNAIQPGLAGCAEGGGGAGETMPTPSRAQARSISLSDQRTTGAFSAGQR